MGREADTCERLSAMREHAPGVSALKLAKIENGEPEGGAMAKCDKQTTKTLDKPPLRIVYMSVEPTLVITR